MRLPSTPHADDPRQHGNTSTIYTSIQIWTWSEQIVSSKTPDERNETAVIPIRSKWWYRLDSVKTTTSLLPIINTFNIRNIREILLIDSTFVTTVKYFWLEKSFHLQELYLKLNFQTRG